MAASDWAPAIGALGGAAAVGAISAITIQGRLWRREQGTRLDRDTLDAYASFLRQASATFDCALTTASLPRTETKHPTKAFDDKYSKTASTYEKLVLLDSTARHEAQQLIWLLWNVGKKRGT